MAARWRTGEETLTIAGMEFFAAGGRHQCHNLEDDEASDSLSDLALDAGGILGTFQGFIDNSLISIIDDTGALSQNIGHLDEENELTLLTALTEILDNTDNENMSPFDTIPDTELLVSSKGRDISSMDTRCSGPNWDLFPDSISSTPKRHNRHKSLRGCLTRNQRSDGEDEEVPSPEKSPALLAFDKDFSIEAGAEIRELERERYLKHGTPCIINTENVTLHDLVKYMHPYCLPAITVCLEPEDRESLLDDSVFLEIVSDQGECIKVPVVVEHPGDELCPGSSEDNPPLSDSSEELHTKTQLSPKSSSGHCDPRYDTNHGKHLSTRENATDSTKGKEYLNTVVLGLEDIATKPLTTDETVNITLDNKRNTDGCNPDLQQMVQGSEKNDDSVICVPVTGKEKLRLKDKKSSKDDNLLNTTKSKVKSKVKRESEEKLHVMSHTVTPQNATQPAPSRLNNPALQESDFLMKTLEQMKKDSQMELRSSRVGRSKVRTRASLDSTNPVRKMTADACKEKVQPHSPHPLEESNLKRARDQSSEPDVAPESAVSVDTQSDEASVQDTGISAAPDVHAKQTSGMEDFSLSKSEDVKDCDSTPCTKDTKPKSVSLSEYRKRLQHRKPNPEQENENLSCSKWPSIPEPPTELADLPCLIVPTKQNKSSVEEKISVPSKVEESSSELNVPVSLGSVPSNVAVTSVCSQEAPQLKPMEPVCSTIVDLIPPPVVASQPNAPPPVVASQPNAPPPFYPPNWPPVPSYPAFYPGMPPLPVVPQYPNCMPPIIPMQPPPPVLGWPSFPPPPVPVGPVHPTGWLSGLPPPYWSSAQAPPMVPDNRCMQSSAENSAAFSTVSVNALTAEKVPKVTPLPSIEHSNQDAVLAKGQANQIPMQKPEHNRIDTREPRVAEMLESAAHAKSTYKASKVCPQVCPNLKKSDSQISSSKAVEKVQSKPPIETMKATVTAPDQQSTSQTISKIMEILKKAQKLGYQIKPPLVSSVSMPSTPSKEERSPVPAIKSAGPEQSVLANVCAQEVPTPVTTTPSIVPPKVDIIPTDQCDTSKVAVEDNTIMAGTLPNLSAQESGLPSPADEVSSGESVQTNHKHPEENFACESGIVASDLSSLLEQFEKYEAKDEDRSPPCPDKLAVGVSGSGKAVEKEMCGKHPEPDLPNTAAPSRPDCQPVISGPLLGKSKSLRGPARRCSSPLKTTKLIEAIPLPRGRLRNRNGFAPQVALPPVHVASGEHDYCFLSASRHGQSPVTDGATTVAPNPPAPCEEGSRWNVKHHQHITIKPIVQFSTQQKKAPAKLPVASAPSVPNPSTDCGLGKPDSPYKSIQKDSNAPLDHRIPATAESTGNSPPASVLRSSDPLPYLSDRGESRTDVKSGNSCVSRRSLRCYRKYTSSPSPQRSTSSDRSGRSSSGSSSSSRSRSRSPPSKRRRTCRSRSRHRRSSSRSSCGTRSSSRSSSRSCSASSSRSRSRSPYRQSYLSRSRRCQSRDSYWRQNNYRKDRAIKERRVVYIGKISGRMTRAELGERFSVFGKIEDCTIHFREKGDNYGFVTYSCTEEAFAAIENGHKLRLPDELAFDLCFGGRRQFCKSNYADLDSNHDDFDPVPVRSKLETLDFETLLREAQKSHRR